MTKSKLGVMIKELWDPEFEEDNDVPRDKFDYVLREIDGLRGDLLITLALKCKEGRLPVGLGEHIDEIFVKLLKELDIKEEYTFDAWRQ